MHVAIIALTLIFVATSASGQQLFVLAGSPTDDFALDLFRTNAEQGLKLVVGLVPNDPGFEWIAVSQELRRAVILSGGDDKSLRVFDLDKAEILKQCTLPKKPNTSVIYHWLADVPGKGQAFEWLELATLDDFTVRAMSLDVSVSCADSFTPADPQEFKYVAAHGTAGVAGVGAAEGVPGVVDKENGLLEYWFGETRIGFDCDPLPLDLRQGAATGGVIVNTRTVLVFEARDRHHENPRLLAFRKRDRTWHSVPSRNDVYGIVQAFGSYVVTVEDRAKAKSRPTASSQTQSASAAALEKSPGQSEWRKEKSAHGPDMEDRLLMAKAIFPGRFHVYNIDTERSYTIVTNQADSEVLLIENETVYYRVSDRLYSAQITEKAVAAGRLLAKAEEIRDVHWAFIQH